jgi:uncharacterized phiE125 gp8 family phage protein
LAPLAAVVLSTVSPCRKHLPNYNSVEGGTAQRNCWAVLLYTLMFYSIEITDAPTELVVSAAELRQHLRLNTTDEDDLLEGCILSATEQFEHHTDGRVVMETTFVQRFMSWDRLLMNSPTRYVSPNLYTLALGRAPVSSVEGVTYYDTEDEVQELEDWETDLTGTPALVYYRPVGMVPYLSLTRPRPIEVEFIAGWEADTVPASVKRAILLLAAHYFDQRVNYGEMELKELPMGFAAICAQYKTGLNP